MAQDRLVQNADGSVTLIYANGAKQTVPASNKAGIAQLKEYVSKTNPSAVSSTTQSSTKITDEMWKQAERDPYYAAQLQDPNLLNLLTNNPDEALKLRQQDRANRVGTLYSELENQYNNLVKLDPNAAYRGRTSDLPTVFNQQAQQLADAGVQSITDLKIQNGTLINGATGKAVTNSNLGGQVAVDRDTGVQKWGDIFSGVQGGANYGIQALDDGSVVLFPAWEKSKSLTQQVLQSDLFKVGSLALAAYGLYNLGTTLASAGGAEAVTAAASSGSGISGAGLTSAEMAALKGAAAYGEGATAAQIAAGAGIPAAALPLEVGQQFTPVPGSFQEALPGLGVETQASAGGFTAAPGSFQAALPGLGIASAPSLAMNLPSQAGSLLTIDNALKALQYGNALGGLLGGPQQQGLIGGGGGVGGRAPGGVDYSELLKSLTRQASVPGVAPLIGPVVQPQESLLGMQVQPVQYQPLNRSLLG